MDEIIYSPEKNNGYNTDQYCGCNGTRTKYFEFINRRCAIFKGK